VFCVTEGGTAQLLDAEGRAVWKQPVGKVVHDAEHVGSRIVVTNAEGDVIALDAATGRVDARVRLPDDPHWSGPAGSAAHADRVWLAHDGGDVACVDLRAQRVAWHVALDTAVRARPAYADGRVVVVTASGSLHSLDPATGREIGRELLGAPTRSPPVTLDAGWAAVTERGQVLRFDATGALVWRFDAKEDVTSPAAFVGGRVVFVTRRGTLVSLRP
jgi:outer membrane protein assembly factor BamB